MGKKHKHSKDTLHKTVSEIKSHYVGPNMDKELSKLHRRLRFDSCCLSLNTISGTPMGLCDEEGYCYVFECDLIVKFLEKYQLHPITGKKVSSNQLIKLNFHKNNEDQYHCPVIYKLFNQHSKIVANRQSGHVYSYEAYHQLNLKPNNFRDLLTNKPFDKEDIVTIQDPDKAETKWAVDQFYFVKNKLKVDDDDESGSNIRNIEQSSVLKASLDEYREKADSIVETFNKIVGQDTVARSGVELDKFNRANESDGTLSRSVTSTVAPVASKQISAQLSNEQVLYPRIKKKGYVQMLTNLGPLNLELYCDRTPKTCHNFLLLATRGYYDNTIFHRLVKNFIVQGGDPTGTGKGGQSAWGEPFADEIRKDLKHIGRGVVSMANSGPGTNKSQFYITLRGAWDHLDGKHTVFGRVVGGDETLDKIESVEVDKQDRPKKEIKILGISKYVDPFELEEANIEKERQNESNARKSKLAASRDGTADQAGAQPLKKFRSGIGSYINLETLGRSISSSKAAGNESEQPEPAGVDDDEQQKNESSLSSKLASLKPKCGGKFGDFSNW